MKGQDKPGPYTERIKMANLGLKAIIANLVGDDSATARTLMKAIGKTISGANMTENELVLSFSDGYKVSLWDNGQNCCEKRYMHTNDDVKSLIGDKFIGAETRDAPEVDDEWGAHEVQFLLISTDKRVVTIETHNEHNGYYGGFAVRAEEVRE